MPPGALPVAPEPPDRGLEVSGERVSRRAVENDVDEDRVDFPLRRDAARVRSVSGADEFDRRPGPPRGEPPERVRVLGSVLDDEDRDRAAQAVPSASRAGSSRTIPLQ